MQAGEAIAQIHARDEETARVAAGEVAAAYELRDEPPRAVPLVLDIVA